MDTAYRDRCIRRLYEQCHLSQQTIAEVFELTQGRVSQICRPPAETSVAEPKKRRGAPPKLTPEQQQAIRGLVEKGPEAFGFEGGVWTRQRLAEVIAETFGVSYEVSSIGLLLKKTASVDKSPSGATLDKIPKRWRTGGPTAYPPAENRPNEKTASRSTSMSPPVTSFPT